MPTYRVYLGRHFYDTPTVCPGAFDHGLEGPLRTDLTHASTSPLIIPHHVLIGQTLAFLRCRLGSGCRQTAAQFVEEVQQDDCVDRSRLRAPGFRRSEHYKAPAVRCDVQIP